MVNRAGGVELASRNDSFGFAERCKKNLRYIEQAYKANDDVHLVTQIITSSLGLIVFPWEQNADRKIRHTPISSLDWPVWTETKPSEGLGELIHHLRNAIAHRNLKFSSDDRDPSNVTVTFGSKDGEWGATISASDLKLFCVKYIELIEQELG